MTADADKNNAFLASHSDIMRNAMQSRRVAPDMPHLIPILDKLPPSAVVCEVGCGPGGITLDIARRYPKLQVLGMDIDKQSIKQANEAANADGVSNIRYAVGDAVELLELAKEAGFEALEGGCDLIYSHAAIMHTANAVRAIKQMSLAAKIGGTISMKEGDMDMFFAYPDLPGMKKFLEIFPKLSATKGADPRLGRKLVSHLITAGHARNDITEVNVQTQLVSRPEQRRGLAGGLDQIFAQTLNEPEWLKDSEVGEEDIELIRKALPVWADDEGAILGFPAIYVVCEKRR